MSTTILSWAKAGTTLTVNAAATTNTNLNMNFAPRADGTGQHR
jgi:hypothetical protein